MYNKALDEISKRIGNKTTFTSDLNMMGKELFGSKFKGVYPSDKIPILTDQQPYAILNLDKSNEPGSHWIAIAKENGKISIYDSFGRDSKDIIPTVHKSGNGKVINSDQDVEQKLIETNCGGRSLAWLFIFDNYGSSNALLI